MEEKVLQPKSHGFGWYMLMYLTALSLLSVGVLCILLLSSGLYLSLELAGDSQISVEYGQSYQEPGFTAQIRGKRLLHRGLPFEIPVEISGFVDESQLGQYILEYKSSAFGLRASETRAVQVVDTQCPVIELLPDVSAFAPGEAYREAGFRAYDNYDGDITAQVQYREEDGKILYSVMDSSGNVAYAQRQIPILKDAPPELVLFGDEILEIPMGRPYVEPGFFAADCRGNDISDRVHVEASSQQILRYRPGQYTITYSVCDDAGRETSAVRTLIYEPCESPRIVYPQEKTIYLTFDDGPCPDTARLLDVLKRYQVQATFFVVDRDKPELMRRIVEEGHSIGIHSQSHSYRKIYSSEDAYFADVFAMQDIIREATGQETWLLRFPGGSSNTVSRFNKGIMTTLTRMAEDAGFAYFDWNVDSDDAGQAKKKQDVLCNVVEGVSANTYSVVLMHDIHSWSVDAVEQIIQWGLANGYSFRSLQMDSPSAHHGVLN